MPNEFYLSDLSEKDKPWDKHKAFADRIRDLYRNTTFQQYAARIEQCSKWLAFALVEVGEGERQFRLQSAQFCRVRHCPVCQWRRSLMWKARFAKALPAIMHDYPKHRWVYLTLTVRNCPVEELRKTITHMNQSFVRLTKLKIYPGVGWVKSLEVTRNTTTLEVHPHFHVLILVKSSALGGNGYVKQEEWRKIWQQCLRVDYEPTVDIRTVKPKNGNALNTKENVVMNAIKETLKYSVKPEDILSGDAQFITELTEQLHKTRTVSIGGVLRNYLSESEPDDDDLIHGEESVETVLEADPWFNFFWGEYVKKYITKIRTESRLIDS